MEAAVSSTVSFDITEVGREDARACLREVLQASRYSGEEMNTFWNCFFVEAASRRIPQGTLVVGDLARIVRRYRDIGLHRWVSSVRRVRPYFVALVRTRHDERYASLIDDLMRHSDFRLTVCRGLDCEDEVRECLDEALAALDPESVIDVRYSPAREKVLRVEFGDGLSGFVGWDELGMRDVIGTLVAESARVGSRGKTIELTAKDGELFEIDSSSVRALLDSRFADEIAARARAADESVGERVRAARKSAGLTQTALGDRAELDQAVISRLERGAHQPRVDTLGRIAAALDMSLSQLLAFTG
jgi:DNA-binding XRE family transcriptional regulator